MQEIWKPIKNYEDYYEISTLGRIKVLQRKVTIQKGPKIGISRIMPEKIMRPAKSKSGYLKVGLVNELGIYGYFRINRLVAQAFLDLDIKSNLVVMHLDNDKLNNTLSNLKLGTCKENNEQRDREGRKASTKGTSNPRHKYKEEDIKNMRTLYSSGESITNISKQLKSNYYTVYGIVKGDSWNHI